MDGSYLGTEALGAAIVHITKSIVYGKFSSLSPRSFGIGLGIGCLLMVGSYIGKKVVDKIDAQMFTKVIEIALGVSGAVLILQAIFS